MTTLHRPKQTEVKLDRLASLLIGAIVMFFLALFMLFQDAEAADLTIGWTAHPEGSSVNIRVQTAPADIGPWTTLTPDVPGSATQRTLPYVVSPGSTGCIRARASRVSDGLNSAWTVPVCATVPAAPVVLEGLYLRLP